MPLYILTVQANATNMAEAITEAFHVAKEYPDGCEVRAGHKVHATVYPSGDVAFPAIARKTSSQQQPPQEGRRGNE